MSDIGSKLQATHILKLDIFSEYRRNCWLEQIDIKIQFDEIMIQFDEIIRRLAPQVHFKVFELDLYFYPDRSVLSKPIFLAVPQLYVSIFFRFKCEIEKKVFDDLCGWLNTPLQGGQTRYLCIHMDIRQSFDFLYKLEEVNIYFVFYLITY